MQLVKTRLAILGGSRAILSDPGDMFTWPIITKEDEDAVLEVLRRGAMSGWDVTEKFEEDYAAWQGARFALGFNNGTSAVQSAMFACNVGTGDEIICPSMTYWASCLPCFSLGATVVFADIEPHSLCLDPNDIEHRITNRTKAIVVVHLLGHPADMDPIMDVARRYNLKVIEDVSHAHGALYKGRKVGSIGHVGAMSLMSGKALPIGEAGILVTDDREIYDRAIAFGHYERFDDRVQTEDLKPYSGLPMGGFKNRMHQLSSAVGRVQLRHFDERAEETRRATNYFWDLLEGVPGLKAHRVPSDSGSTMGGWYAPHGLYRPEEVGGLSVTRFIEALEAEGFNSSSGSNRPLHLHPLFNTCDVYGDGRPTRIANSDRDVRQPAGSLPISESIGERLYSIPGFKHYRPHIIEEYASAFRNVAESYRDLLPGDMGNPPILGRWHLSRRE